MSRRPNSKHRVRELQASMGRGDGGMTRADARYLADRVLVDPAGVSTAQIDVDEGEIVFEGPTGMYSVSFRDNNREAIENHWIEFCRRGRTRARLTVARISQKDAFAFVTERHRHHKRPAGSVCQIAAKDSRGEVHGVAVIGRPVSRMLDDGETAEITRVCTDGWPNAASFLITHARQAALALGFTRVITYTLPREGGASLRGAGATLDGKAGGGSWNSRSRPRVDKHPTERKHRWVVAAA